MNKTSCSGLFGQKVRLVCNPSSVELLEIEGKKTDLSKFLVPLLGMKYKGE